MYAFSRHFYPKQLTSLIIQVIHLLSVCVFPGNWTHDICAANAMLHHWATGTLNTQLKKYSWMLNLFRVLTWGVLVLMCFLWTERTWEACLANFWNPIRMKSKYFSIWFQTKVNFKYHAPSINANYLFQIWTLFGFWYQPVGICEL